MFKILTLLIALTSSAIAISQHSNSTYYIDVLIDADRNIYFHETVVPLEDVSKITKSKVNKLKFVKGKRITYRIFAEAKLELGDIIEVQNRMYQGFSQPNLATRRFLLQTSEIPLDKSNWINQLNKLNLKAIEKQGLVIK